MGLLVCVAACWCTRQALSWCAWGFVWVCLCVCLHAGLQGRHLAGVQCRCTRQTLSWCGSMPPTNHYQSCLVHPEASVIRMSFFFMRASDGWPSPDHTVLYSNIILSNRNKRCLTRITLFRQYVYSTIRLNRPSKGAYFRQFESTKDSQTFFTVQALKATELALDLDLQELYLIL